MTIKEANAIIDSVAEKNKTEWEQTRWLGYIQALSNGATLKSPIDLLKFSWEHTEESNTSVKDTRTKEEIRNSLIELKNSFK